MFRRTEGFALPTILISSVIMLMVLVSAVTATEGVHTALDRQYYNQLAREAAESGMAVAQLCLQSNGYTPSWSASYPLQPDKDCTGMNSNGASHWIINQNNIQTTFSVAYPTNNNVSQNVVSTGTVQLLRPSSGLPWRTFTYSASASIGVNLNTNTIAFGYSYNAGAYFGTIAADNTLRMVGYNGTGQLGNGTTVNTLTPTKFGLNGTDIPVNVFTNFVSGGNSTFVLTNSGQIWGAGANWAGQLGNGTTTQSSTAVQFQLPAGKTPQYVSVGASVTFVLTTDGNIYAAGECAYGQLGSNYTISGCSNKSLYQRVNLPTPTSDPNTIPTTNITNDYHSTFVRMQGGKVYGWGGDSNSIFGSSSTSDTSNPVQIGTFGNTGQPTAKQIFTDGNTLWIIDSNGTLWGEGGNMYGELGGMNISIYNASQNQCIDNKTQDGATIWTYACNWSPAQQFTFQSDKSIYNANKNVCLDNYHQDGVTLDLYTCNGTAAQQFQMHADGTITDVSNGKCVQTPSANTLSLGTCTSGAASQVYSLPDQNHLIQFNMPSQAGTATKIWTDQWYVEALTSNGQVWGAGYNANGYLGAGSTWTHQNFPVQFILPNGVTATDLYVTCSSPSSDQYCDTYVIGSDGKVYGAGSNPFGQLGNGTTTDQATPVAMQVIDGVTNRAAQVLAGYGTAVILTTNHKVFTVGNNSNGQLGDGTTVNESVPEAAKYTNILPVTSY